MTVAVPTPGGSVVPYDDDLVGFEDVTTSDLMVPRLRIVHKDGVFEDSLSKARFDTLDVILLALVKQRIMWDETVDDGDTPQCKSTDHVHGFPNVDPEAKRKCQFPWGKSNFSTGDAKPITIEPGTSREHPNGWHSNGLDVLPCANCVFKEWNKGDWRVPPCSEQHTYPLLYSPDGDLSNAMPALLTVQKTGIKPSKTYINSYAQRRDPLFTAVTRLTLRQESRGSVTYAVPEFRKIGATENSSWSEFSEQARQIRSFIRTAPRSTAAEDEAVAATEGARPAAEEKPSATQAQPAEAASPVSSTPAVATPATASSAAPADDEDDMPF
jgi:hypothetical protein